MKEQNRNLLIVSIIMIVIVAIIFYSIPKEQEEVGINFHYYDSEGREIFPPTNSLAIVNGEPFTPSSFNLDIKITNIGNTDFTASISDASPLVFKQALQNKGTLNIPKGSFGTWESDLMTISDFIGSTDFKVWILAEKTGLSSETKVQTKGLTVSMENVIFRTNDLNYYSNSEIAYNSGGGMQRYRVGSTASTSSSCNLYLEQIIFSSSVFPCTQPECVFGTRSGDYKVCYKSGINYEIRNYILGGSSVSTSDLFQPGYEGKEVWNVQVCESNWQCTAWSECAGETQTRTCTDLNACGSEAGKPSESQSCTTEPPVATCSDGIKNQDEVCVDIGGVCGGQETPETSCSDGKDNDCDGLIDGADTDCAPPVSYVKFRTTDLSYASGSAIAFTDTCGSNLIAYGYVGASGLLSGNCESISTWCGANPTKVLSNLPGEWRAGGSIPNLWKSDEVGTLCICDSDGSKQSLHKYKTSSSDASKVSTSSTSIETSREVPC